jgi:hypothetical protein
MQEWFLGTGISVNQVKDIDGAGFGGEATVCRYDFVACGMFRLVSIQQADPMYGTLDLGHGEEHRSLVGIKHNEQGIVDFRLSVNGEKLARVSR